MVKASQRYSAEEEVFILQYWNQSFIVDNFRIITVDEI